MASCCPCIVIQDILQKMPPGVTPDSGPQSQACLKCVSAHLGGASTPNPTPGGSGEAAPSYFSGLRPPGRPAAPPALPSRPGQQHVSSVLPSPLPPPNPPTPTHPYPPYPPPIQVLLHRHRGRLPHGERPRRLRLRLCRDDAHARRALPGQEGQGEQLHGVRVLRLLRHDPGAGGIAPAGRRVPSPAPSLFPPAQRQGRPLARRLTRGV